MVTREDFKYPFQVNDVLRRLTHTLTTVEYTGNEPIGDYVAVTDFVFYPQDIKRSRFSLVAPDYGQKSMQQGSLSFDALELFVGKADFHAFLGFLHDLCSDFAVGEDEEGRVKYDYNTEKWEEKELPDPVY
jgi:hypothetical protein